MTTETLSPNIDISKMLPAWRSKFRSPSHVDVTDAPTFDETQLMSLERLEKLIQSIPGKSGEMYTVLNPNAITDPVVLKLNPTVVLHVAWRLPATALIYLEDSSDSSVNQQRLEKFYRGWGRLMPPSDSARRNAWDRLIVDDPSSSFWKSAYLNLVLKGFARPYSITTQLLAQNWREQLTYYLLRETTTFDRTTLQVRVPQYDPNEFGMSQLQVQYYPFDESENSWFRLFDSTSRIEQYTTFAAALRLFGSLVIRGVRRNLRDTTLEDTIEFTISRQEDISTRIEFAAPTKTATSRPDNVVEIRFDAVVLQPVSRRLDTITTLKDFQAETNVLKRSVPHIHVRYSPRIFRQNLFPRCVVFVYLGKRNALLHLPPTDWHTAISRLVLRRMYAPMELVLDDTNQRLSQVIEVFRYMQRITLQYMPIVNYLFLVLTLDPENINSLLSCEIRDNNIGVIESCREKRAALRVRWLSHDAQSLQSFDAADPSTGSNKAQFTPTDLLSSYQKLQQSNESLPEHIPASLPIHNDEEDASEDDIDNAVEELSNRDDIGHVEIGLYVGNLYQLFNRSQTWDTRRCFATIIDPNNLMQAAWHVQYISIQFQFAGTNTRVLFRVARFRTRSLLMPLPDIEILGPSLYPVRFE